MTTRPTTPPPTTTGDSRHPTAPAPGHDEGSHHQSTTTGPHPAVVTYPEIETEVEASGTFAARFGKPARNGLLLMFLASILFSAMSAFIKLACEGLPVIEAVFFRSILSFGILLVLPFKRRGPRLGHNKKLLILRGVLGFLGLMGTFYGIAHMELADAMVVYHTWPLWVLAIAAVFLKESFGKAQILLTIVGLVGVVLIVKPGMSSDYVSGLVTFVGALFAAAAYVIVRKLAQTEDGSTIVLYFMGLTAIISLPLLIPVFVVPTFVQALALVGIAVTAVGAQLLMTRAYRFEEAGKAAMIGYSGVVFSAIWGGIFWGEIPDIYSIVGGVLILGACLVTTRMR